jgi:hypothetical protein
LQRLTAAACVVIFGSTTIIFGFEKEHLCQGSIRSQTSRAVVGDTRRASEIWFAPAGGDSRAWHRLVGNYQPRNQQDAASDQNERYQSFRHGTLLVHYIKKLGEAGHFEV